MPVFCAYVYRARCAVPLCGTGVSACGGAIQTSLTFILQPLHSISLLLLVLYRVEQKKGNLACVLAVWLSTGLSGCQAATKVENSNENFFLFKLVGNKMSAAKLPFLFPA